MVHQYVKKPILKSAAVLVYVVRTHHGDGSITELWRNEHANTYYPKMQPFDHDLQETHPLQYQYPMNTISARKMYELWLLLSCSMTSNWSFSIYVHVLIQNGCLQLNLHFLFLFHKRLWCDQIKLEGPTQHLECCGNSNESTRNAFSRSKPFNTKKET